MFRLFTTYYREPHPDRREELDLCLSLNCATFDSTCVLADNVEKPHWFRGHWKSQPERQTYQQLIQWAQGMCAGNEPSVADDDMRDRLGRPPLPSDDIVVIANCDILLDRRQLDVIAENLQANECYALTRYDFAPKTGARLWNVDYSQDAWVFRGPPMLDIGGGYPFGVPGCDNRFAHELDAASVHRGRIRELADVTVHRPSLHDDGTVAERQTEIVCDWAQNVVLRTSLHRESAADLARGIVDDVAILVADIQVIPKQIQVARARATQEHPRQEQREYRIAIGGLLSLIFIFQAFASVTATTTRPSSRSTAVILPVLPLSLPDKILTKSPRLTLYFIPTIPLVLKR
jgi:hypothetical protein